MRKNLLVLLGFLFCYFSSSAQWQWLNPTPSGYINTKLTFISKDTGFLFNYAGDLFKTTNQSASWQIVQNFPPGSAMDIAHSTGVIAGWNNTLYISTDNGLNWTFKNPGIAANFTRIDIISRDTILLVDTDRGKIFKSTNRGDTWQPLGTPNTNIRSVDFINSNLGFVASYNGIYRTVDGGNNWQLVHPISTSAGLLVIKFYNDQVGYAYREFDQMLRTVDGGATWTISYLPDDISDIFFVDQLNAYAVGEHGVTYRTVNGGINWTWASSGARIYQHDLYSQYFFNDTTGIVVGARGRILKTSNGGSSWTQSSPTYIDVTDISFGTINTGYATTWNNIYKTTNKGQTWSPLALTPVGSNSRFDHCIFFNADTGFVTATDQLTFYKTVNGGQSWNTSYPPAGYDYVSGISFINSTTGYASFRTSSAYGIFKTTDGGTAWQQIGSYQNYHHLQFLNEQTGYATQYRKLFRTTDGAQTWTEVLNSQNDDLNSIYFIDAKKGFAAGDNGFLKMTTDSGKTWASVSPAPFYDDFYTIKFYDSKAGYLTSESGGIYKSTDGGSTWQKNGQSSFNECMAITFTNDSSVYIAGMYGTILTNKISEYNIASLIADNITACSGRFSTVVTAALSTVDSIWFQYGINDFNNSVLGSPSNVSNNQITSLATVANLNKSTSYRLRVRVLYKGAYQYSNTINFTTSALPKPAITDSANTLISSAFSGNQWFLGGQIISGAVNKSYTPISSGIYTVQVTQGGCLSQLSDDFNFTYTGDSSLQKQTMVFPNPARNSFNIKNPGLKNLEITIADVYGRVILVNSSNNSMIVIPVVNLSSGNYYVTVRDMVSKEKITHTFFKL